MFDEETPISRHFLEVSGALNDRDPARLRQALSSAPVEVWFQWAQKHSVLARMAIEHRYSGLEKQRAIRDCVALSLAHMTDNPNLCISAQASLLGQAATTGDARLLRFLKHQSRLVRATEFPLASPAQALYKIISSNEIPSKTRTMCVKMALSSEAAFSSEVVPPVDWHAFIQAAIRNASDAQSRAWSSPASVKSQIGDAWAEVLLPLVDSPRIKVDAALLSAALSAGQLKVAERLWCRLKTEEDPSVDSSSLVSLADRFSEELQGFEARRQSVVLAASAPASGSPRPRM